MTTVCIRETWPMGHRLQQHDGKCRHLHGHTYAVEVEIEGPIVDGGPSDGMVVDFGHVKAPVRALVASLDHAMMLQDTDPVAPACADYSLLVTVPFAPTTENLCSYVFALLSQRLSESVPSVRLSRVRISESPTTWAEVRA